jgi:hypothetical protein
MFVFAIAILGCDQTTGEQPDQLEASEAVYDQIDEYEGAVLAGDDATIAGGDRDWSVTVNAGATSPTVDLHVPGASDLSVLEGASLDIELGEAWGDETRTVRIDDESGPRFLVQTSEGGPASDLFGAAFVAFGDEVGTGTMKDEYGRWGVSYRVAVFETDDGAVEANPGEPFVATIDGRDWRIVVHASFEVTSQPASVPGCGGGIGTTLSFEMLAVETPPALDAIAPLSGARTAGQHVCG